MKYLRVPPTPGSFEERVAANLRSLRNTILILGAGLLIAIGAASYGLWSASVARDHAAKTARVQAVASHAQAKLTQREAQLGQQIARSAQNAAATATRLAFAIQRQRYEACLSANQRHNATVGFLDSLIRKLPPAQRRTKRTRASIRQTIAFVNAIVPYTNCAKFAPPVNTR